LNYRKRILVIRLSALGDVAILQPVLRLRAQRCPDVLFLLAAPPRLEPLFRGVDNIQFVPTQKRQSPRQLYTALSPLHPDLVADMHHVNRVIGLDWLFRLHGVPVRSIRKHAQIGRPSWLRYNDVLDRCGLPPVEEISALSTDYWQPKPTDGKHYTVGIAPFAQHQGKIWPLEFMEVLIQLLSYDGQYTIYLFGSKEEAAILDPWAARYPNTVSLAGKYDFDEELRQISQLDLMVSMDSANMHFASCLGIPVVSIWGATHPSRGFYGWRQNPDWALQHDFDCRPCSKYGSKPCRQGDYPCLWSVSPQEVLLKIESVLQVCP
jgi:ADP-heptose:LPS heptosyltransferase